MRMTLRQPSGQEAPDHVPQDVLDALVQAVASVTGVPAPVEITFDTSPRVVFSWVGAAIVTYGDECREEGQASAARELSPRIPPEVAPAVLAACRELVRLLK